MSSEGLAENFQRAADRPQWQQAFSVEGSKMMGASNKEKMTSYPSYKNATDVYNNCMLYARSYAAAMVQRVVEEEPDFFEEKGTTREEFTAHLENNMCLGASKYRAAVVKDTQAKILDDHYTTDQVRRLVNGGQKFHPYF